MKSGDRPLSASAADPPLQLAALSCNPEPFGIIPSPKDTFSPSYWRGPEWRQL